MSAMADHPRSIVRLAQVVLVEEEMSFTFVELCRACRSDAAPLIALVDEGVLEPAGSGPDDWQFSGVSLRRARAAVRLVRDLELAPAGTALVLDLLDEIDALRSALRRAGVR
ncbi:MAG: MerR family transcriptional regulator [Methylibium sp.]|nr:MerR family transcriptional regulator [Methylibium sp.]